MAKDNNYADKVYGFLKTNGAIDVDLTPTDFRDNMKDPEYANNIYGTLLQGVERGLVGKLKSKKDFFGEFGTPEYTPPPQQVQQPQNVDIFQQRMNEVAMNEPKQPIPLSPEQPPQFNGQGMPMPQQPAVNETGLPEMQDLGQTAPGQAPLYELQPPVAPAGLFAPQQAEVTPKPSLSQGQFQITDTTQQQIQLPQPKIQQAQPTVTTGTGATENAERETEVVQMTRNALNQGKLSTLVTATGTPNYNQLVEIANINRELQQAEPSEAMKAVRDEPGLMNELKASPEMIYTSLLSMIRGGYGTVGASIGTGTAIGALSAGLPGAIAGAGYGLGAGMGAAGGKVEYSSSLMEGLQAQGVDITNPDDLNNAFNNPLIIDRAKKFAAKRTAAIMVIDGVSAGVAGRLGVGKAATTIGNVGRLGGELANQVGGGAGGEALAQYISGQKLNWSEIRMEAMGELGGAPSEIASAKLRGVKDIPTPQEGANKLAAVAPMKPEQVDAFVDMNVQAGDIPAENAEQAKETLKKANEVNAKIPDNIVNPEMRSEAIGLIQERESLTAQLEGVDEAFKPAIDEKIKAINQRLSDMATAKPAEVVAETEVKVEPEKAGQVEGQNVAESQAEPTKEAGQVEGQVAPAETKVEAEVKAEARAEKEKIATSILDKDTDLQGNEKEDFMIPVTYSESKRVGDKVDFINSQGENMTGNYRGTNNKGEAIIDTPTNKNGKKFNTTFVVQEDKVTFPKYADTGLGKGDPDAIQYAIENNLFTDAIAQGKMTANDAKSIIESGGLEVPKDILEQATTETKPEITTETQAEPTREAEIRKRGLDRLFPIDIDDTTPEGKNLLKQKENQDKAIAELDKELQSLKPTKEAGQVEGRVEPTETKVEAEVKAEAKPAPTELPKVKASDVRMFGLVEQAKTPELRETALGRMPEKNRNAYNDYEARKQEAIDNGMYNPKTGEMTYNGKTITLDTPAMFRAFLASGGGDVITAVSESKKGATKSTNPALESVEATAKALEGKNEFKAESHKYFEYVPISEIEKYKEFDRATEKKWGSDDNTLDELINDISKNGIKTPITLQIDRNGNALVVEGNTRLAAAKKLGIKNIPVRIVSGEFGSINKHKAKKIGKSRSLGEMKVFYPNVDILNQENSPALYGFSAITNTKNIPEAYHKAKADGSNPELVKAVEELLGGKNGSENSTRVSSEVGTRQESKQAESDKGTGGTEAETSRNDETPQSEEAGRESDQASEVSEPKEDFIAKKNDEYEELKKRLLKESGNLTANLNPALVSIMAQMVWNRMQVAGVRASQSIKQYINESLNDLNAILQSQGKQPLALDKDDITNITQGVQNLKNPNAKPVPSANTIGTSQAPIYTAQQTELARKKAEKFWAEKPEVPVGTTFKQWLKNTMANIQQKISSIGAPLDYAESAIMENANIDMRRKTPLGKRMDMLSTRAKQKAKIYADRLSDLLSPIKDNLADFEEYLTYMRIIDRGIQHEENLAQYDKDLAQYEIDRPKYEDDVLKYEADRLKYEADIANGIPAVKPKKPTAPIKPKKPTSRMTGGITPTDAHILLNDMYNKLGNDVYQKLVDAGDELQTLYDDNLKDLLKAGIISKKRYNDIKNQNTFYVPFDVIHRDYKGGILGATEPKGKMSNVDLKKIKGIEVPMKASNIDDAIKGFKKLLDDKQITVDQYYWLANNKADELFNSGAITEEEYNNLMDALSEPGFELGSIIDKTMRLITASQYSVARQEYMKDVDALVEADKDNKFFYKLKPLERSSKGMEVITYYKDGKKQRVETTTPIAKAIDRTNRMATNAILWAMHKVSIPFKLGATTLNTTFIPVNFIIDLHRTLALSEAGIGRGATIPERILSPVIAPIIYAESFIESFLGNILNSDIGKLLKVQKYTPINYENFKNSDAYSSMNDLRSAWFESEQAQTKPEVMRILGEKLNKAFSTEAMDAMVKVFKQTGKVPSKAIDFMAMINNILEQTHKVYAQKRLEGIEAGDRKGIDKYLSGSIDKMMNRKVNLTPDQKAEALEDIASEVRNMAGTPDFSNIPPEIRVVSLFLPFLAANIKGNATDLGRLSTIEGGKGSMERAVNAWAGMALTIGLPSFLGALYMNLEDDDDEQKKLSNEMDERNKYKNMEIPISYTDENGNRVKDIALLPLRGPSVFVSGVSKLAGKAVAESIREAGGEVKGKEILDMLTNSFGELNAINLSSKSYGNANKRLKNNFESEERLQSLFSGLNPLLKFPIEQAFNTDTYGHRDIIPEKYPFKVSLKKMYVNGLIKPHEVATEGISPNAVAISKALYDEGNGVSVSAATVDHFLRTFTADYYNRFEANPLQVINERMSYKRKLARYEKLFQTKQETGTEQK